MSNKYSIEFIKKAHKSTLFNEEEIKKSTVCTCFYCGYQFNPKEEKEVEWWDENNPKGKTIVCPKCGIDAVIGDGSIFPVTDKDFILESSTYFFNGYSRISDKEPIEKIKKILIEID